MRRMNEFLATGRFDLYELQLFHLVAEHKSFTRAGHAAGLTQSAITRQIRGMEDRLGVRLFDRTTRSVRLTPAGAALHARSGAILAEGGEAITALKHGSVLEPRTLRIGIGQSIGRLPARFLSAISERISWNSPSNFASVRRVHSCGSGKRRVGSGHCLRAAATHARTAGQASVHGRIRSDRTSKDKVANSQ